jgi:thiol:disulfide interchange protein
VRYSRKAFALAALAVAVACLAPAPLRAQVQVALVSAAQSVQPGHSVELALQIRHEPPWHTFGSHPGIGYPTRIVWNLPAGWHAADLQWPTPIPIRDAQGAITGEGYEGLVYLPVTVTAAADAQPGRSVTLQGVAHWLMCSVVCVPGSAAVQLTLPITAQAPRPNGAVIAELARMQMPGGGHGDTPAGARSLTAAATGPASNLMPGVWMLAFLGGLVLNLMPCVFPVLAIKVMSFVGQAGGARAQATAHGLVYAAGVVLSFWMLACILLALRAAGHSLGWGFQLQSAGFVFVLTALLLLVALSLSGVFQLGGSVTGFGSSLQSRPGYGGSFFSGVLATVVATPCSAPFLAPALGSALTFPPLTALGLFTAIALGLAAPYLVLSAWPRATRLLPKPGPWMQTVRQLLAFPLYASAAYLVWVLAGQRCPASFLDSLFGLTLVAMGAWVYGRQAPARARLVACTAAVLIVTLGLALGWPTRPAGLKWEPWSSLRVAELRAAGTPIFVDFTARWCATCQANKRVVFSSVAVQKYIRSHHIALLEADWTNSDPSITAELARWHRAAVPFDLVYGHTAAQPPRVLPEILTPGEVLRALQETP